MSVVAIGLFVLACGWNLYRLFLPTRSAALRNEGHPQYFGAALAAGYIGLLALFLNAAAAKQISAYIPAIHALNALAPNTDRDEPQVVGVQYKAGGDKASMAGAIRIERGGRAQIAPAAHSAASLPSPLETSALRPYETVLAVGLWSALLALLLPAVLNAPFKRNARLRMLTGYKTLNDVEAALVNALDRGCSIAITLISGKVYVGIPNEFDINGAEADWISVWPLVSGYRTKKGRLKFTTTYQQAYDRMIVDDEALRKVDDFRVTLPTAHIVSIQTFKLSTYIEHFADRIDGDADDEQLSDALSEVEERAPGPNLTLPVVSSSPASYWPKVVPDGWLRFLKWSFHLLFTASVVALPFSPLLSFGLIVIAWFVLSLCDEPADLQLQLLLEALRDA
jgi:hypothetical protein